MIHFRKINYTPAPQKFTNGEMDYYVKGFDFLINQKVFNKNEEDKFTRFRFYSFLYIDKYKDELKVLFDVNSNGNFKPQIYVSTDIDIPFSKRKYANKIIYLNDASGNYTDDYYDSGYSAFDKVNLNIKDIEIKNIENYKSLVELKEYLMNICVDEEIKEIENFLRKNNVAFTFKEYDEFVLNHKSGVEKTLSNIEEFSYFINAYLLNKYLESNILTKTTKPSINKI